MDAEILELLPKEVQVIGISVFLFGVWKIFRKEFISGIITMASGLVIAFAIPIVRFLVFFI